MAGLWLCCSLVANSRILYNLVWIPIFPALRWHMAYTHGIMYVGCGRGRWRWWKIRPLDPNGGWCCGRHKDVSCIKKTRWEIFCVCNQVICSICGISRSWYCFAAILLKKNLTASVFMFNPSFFPTYLPYKMYFQKIIGYCGLRSDLYAWKLLWRSKFGLKLPFFHDKI